MENIDSIYLQELGAPRQSFQKLFFIIHPEIVIYMRLYEVMVLSQL